VSKHNASLVPLLTLIRGAGNIFHKSHSPASEERGRGSDKGEHKGVFGSVLRSLSRATGRD
jgi:hypothetical protein